MNCEQAREQFSAYVEGGLDEARLVIFKEHLGSCPKCAEDSKAFACVWSSLGKVDVVEPPYGFHERVMGRLAELHESKNSAAQRVSFWDVLLGRTQAVQRRVIVVAGALLVMLSAASVFVPAGRTWVSALVAPAFQRYTPANPQDAIAIHLSPRPVEGSTSTLSIEINPQRDVTDAQVLARLVPGVKTSERDIQDFNWKVNLRRGDYTAMSVPLEFTHAGILTLRVKILGNDGKYRVEKMAFLPIRSKADAHVRAGSASINLSAQDMDIYEALGRLSLATKTPIIMDPDLHGKISVELNDCRLGEALAKVLEPLGYTWNAAGGVYIVRDAPIEK